MGDHYYYTKDLVLMDAWITLGDVILGTLGGRSVDKKLLEYLKLANRIYRLLAEVHDEVAKVTIKASVAMDSSEAKETLKRIQHENLEKTFRLRKWCDEFECLGHALKPLGEDAGLVGENQATWDKLCNGLVKREGEVARLYDGQLSHLRSLSLSVDDLPLDKLKKEVDEISVKLVTQKAQFDLLARKAETIHERLVQN